MARTRLPPVASTSWCVLGPDRPPPDVPRHRWRQFVNDCHNFLNPSEDWVARAARLGWDAIGLFGCAPRRPLAIIPPGRRTPVRCRSGSHRYAAVSVLNAKMRMRFWAVCLLAFELLLPPTRFSARLVSASWLVIFVHLVRCSGIVFISNHRADLPAMVVLALKSCLITIMAPSRPAAGTP